MGFFKKLFGGGPQSARDCLDRGNAHFGKGEYDRAVADYTEAIRLDPDHAEAYITARRQAEKRGK